MRKAFYRMANKFFFPKGLRGVCMVAFLCGLMILCTLVVAWSGGTHTSYLHSFYFPIIVAGMSFGMRGGSIAGLLSTLLVGPYMPESYEPFTLQTTQVWVFRGLFFTAIGTLSGLGASIFRNFLEAQKLRLLTDPVTGLLNLRGLKQYLDESENTRPADLTVIVMEIHRLQEIEQAIGPEATQRLLRQVGEKLKTIATESLYIGHLETGGFVIVTDSLTAGQRLIERCQNDLGQTFLVNDIPLFIEIYFGLAHSSADSESVVSILRKAKIAVIKGQQAKHIQTVFDDQDDERSKRHITIIHDVNEALLNNELKLYYQPKINLKTGQISGVEVLVRWPHPRMGMIPPSEFVPLIEKTLLINPYTKWLLQKSLSQLSAWQRAGLEISMAVNFSMANFQDFSILEVLFQLLETYQIAPKHVEIEITETTVADNIRKIADILYSLRKRGIRIAVDDFGTGQSSLQYLCELPVDTLKIDKVFTQSMLTNSASEAIIRSAILLGHELKLLLVAEGIETQEQLEHLKTLGCDIGQGYFLAKPMPVELATEWLMTKSAGIS